jgi:hypothetical protein
MIEFRNLHWQSLRAAAAGRGNFLPAAAAAGDSFRAAM